MDKNFLLTYYFNDDEGRQVQGFSWYYTEEEMEEDFEILKEDYNFEMGDCIEVISCRNIEID